MKDVILTSEGLQKLKDELEHLTTVRRREVSERIKHSLEGGGDIAENAEYLDAKEELEQLEGRIALLEQRLRNSRVIEATKRSPGVVALGTRVRLRDLDAKKSQEYLIVGSAEANPAENKLSNESPVGRAILGHKKGEIVEVATPSGTLKFKIMDVKAG